MRVQKLAVSYSNLLGLLILDHPEFRKLTTNLPNDVRVIRVEPENGREVVNLILESATFDDVPEFGVIMDFPIAITVSIPTLRDHLDALLKENE
jgi:hypothetical protein